MERLRSATDTRLLIEVLSNHISRVKEEKFGFVPAGEEFLIIIVREGHNRNLQLGSRFVGGWEGEGEINVVYQDGNVESFGGELTRGGVKDAEIYEIYTPLLTEEEITILSQLPGFKLE
ncbi:MAG: hypothetical protein G01um10145_479 [Microgenomates group bacterium Gr01-1014_5]|nr:MAG: hypothetical protein G01um10145_479 [Microgenomates group bacterium Gr01-1014_5]